MKPSFAAWKRRIKLNARVLCVHNGYRPNLNGTMRTVVKVQTVSFAWMQDGEPEGTQRSWTTYSKAAHATMIDADTVEWVLDPKAQPGDRFHGCTLRLQIVAEGIESPPKVKKPKHEPLRGSSWIGTSGRKWIVKEMIAVNRYHIQTEDGLRHGEATAQQIKANRGKTSVTSN